MYSEMTMPPTATPNTAIITGSNIRFYYTSGEDVVKAGQP